MSGEDSDSSANDEESRVPKRKRRTSPEMPRIHNFIPQIVSNYNATEFQSHFRLSRAAYEWLLRKLGPELITKKFGRPSIDVEKQLLSVMWILATPDSFRSVAYRFGMPKGSLHACFKRVIRALNWLCPRVVQWPDVVERERIKASLKQLGGLDGAVAIIDSTYVRIKAPRDNPEVYVNGKCFYGITLQGICDNQHRFLDAFAGYPSSVSDIRIFRNSDIYRDIIRHPTKYFSPNEYIIGDEAYETKTFCVPPYREGNNFTQWQREFNHHHARTRQVVERTFALFFGRFHRLKNLDMTLTEWIPATIMAAVALHNICLLEPADHLRAQFEAEGTQFLEERSIDDPGMRNVAAPIEHSNHDGELFRDQIAREMGLLDSPAQAVEQSELSG